METPKAIEDSLFQVSDEAQLLQKMDWEEAFKPEMNPIHSDTLSSLMQSQQQPYLIIDCRWGYEFSGGHIKGAFNIDNSEDLELQFIKNIQNVRQLMTERTIIVFHCEYSQKRGPKLWSALRQLDRNANLEMERYPQLYYPEMYLLEGGYK